MDYATRMAIRALVSGLSYGGTIDQRHVSAIVKAMFEASEKCGTDNRVSDQLGLRSLCMEIARDGQVEAPIDHAEPPSRFG